MKRRLLLAAALFVTTTSLHAQDEEAPPSFVRRFEGTLGKNLGITLFFTEREISESGFLYDAAYHYHKSGLTIPLVHDAEAEGFQFREIAGYSPEGEEQITGRWSITMEEDRITGTWTAPDGKKKLPIALKESYPVGTVKVERLKIDFSYIEQIGTTRRGNQMDVTFLRVRDKKAQALSSRLAQLARNSIDPDGKLPATPEALTKHLRDQVRGEMEADQNYISSQSEDFRVCMNESGFLTVENASYAFEGGAHGNHGSGYHTLDIATGKELKLADLVKPGFEEKWAALGRAEILRSRGQKPEASLKEAGLFDDNLELNENWFLVPGGIGFSYSPYEIAAYAMGSIEFTLPWKDIIDDLKPGTKVHDIATKLVGKAKE
jgi:hypothetical protein